MHHPTLNLSSKIVETPRKFGQTKRELFAAGFFGQKYRIFHTKNHDSPRPTPAQEFFTENPPHKKPKKSRTGKKTKKKLGGFPETQSRKKRTVPPKSTNNHRSGVGGAYAAGISQRVPGYSRGSYRNSKFRMLSVCCSAVSV